MASESAIIVPVREVEPIVASLRLQYDEAASLGVPAHITLLYPFSPRDNSRAAEVLTQLFREIPAFDFSFTEVRRFPATVYLHPNKPGPFVHMIHALQERWPECLPYGGAFSDIVPHLTVAHQDDPKLLDVVEQSLAGLLPVACAATEAWLVRSDETGQWSKQATFPFLTA